MRLPKTDRAVTVYPACAGIDLLIGMAVVLAARLPRMRGDRPNPWMAAALRAVFTPHARGSTEACIIIAANRLVYPACAGIDRRRHRRPADVACLPRMRGDRPLIGLM